MDSKEIQKLQTKKSHLLQDLERWKTVKEMEKKRIKKLRQDSMNRCNYRIRQIQSEISEINFFLNPL